MTYTGIKGIFFMRIIETNTNANVNFRKKILSSI